MGPEATVLLMERVIAKTRARDDSDHVPLIVDNNTQVPSRIKAIIEKTGDDPGTVLADMAKQLARNGAQALAMPCNTAHHYASIIEASVDIPFLNMVQLSVERIANMNMENRRVGILASPAVRTTGIFDQAFSPLQFETIYPLDQERMLEAIRIVKADSMDRRACQILESAARDLVEQRADILLIACSELSIIADAIPASIPRLDTINILAESIINFSGAKMRDDQEEAVWHKST